MSEFEIVVTQMIVLWAIIAAIVMMVRGPEAAMAVVAWPLRVAYRTVRWALGSALVALGNAIRGRPRRDDHDRRRR